jgi:CMP-N-acetylneuraminic acid synthetase/RimJ/RimL family protein N-acetyltransferase
MRPLLGTPLVAWSIRAALASRLDRVVVTTEDAEIAECARRYGADVPFMRPDALAADYARSDDILLQALDATEALEGRAYDIVAYIQPTTPLVRPADIDAAIGVVASGAAACCFTARDVTEPPWWMFVQDKEGHARPFIAGSIEGEREHSQKLEKAHFPTGAVWALDCAALRAQRRVYCEPLRMVMMDPERSIDIDDETDWIIAEALARHRGFAPEPAKGGCDDQASALFTRPLLGRQVKLSPIRSADVTPRYVAWLNDPEVNRYSRRSSTQTSFDQARRYLETLAPEEYVLGVHLTGEGHVGNIKVGPIDYSNSRADISILIGERRVWGRGVAREAIYLVTRYLFEVAGINRVEAGSANPAFLRAVHSLGWRQEGVQRARVRVGEALLDWTLVSLLRDEFAVRTEFEPQAA